MRKIDKLVEEAEQSISKVVNGFDKFFKEPSTLTYPSMDSTDPKRKNIEFNIDETCDCPDTLRCDCETKFKEGSDTNMSFLSGPVSDAPTPDETNSDHLNTISERTESVDTSQEEAISRHDVKSVFSDTGPTDDVPLRVRNIKKDVNITIDTRNIVQIPSIPEPPEVTPIMQEIATETEDMVVDRLPTNGLEIQSLPGVEIRPPCVIQKIYNISINPTGSLTDQSEFAGNTLYIELKHQDPILEQVIDSASHKSLEVSDASKISEKVQEIEVLKAPNTNYRKKGPQCCGCHNKDKTIEQLLDDIKDFQIPIATTTSRNLSSSGSSDSEYVMVQDIATQVSVQGSRDAPDAIPPVEGKACCSTGNNTSTDTFPTNVRPPLPGQPISTYQPAPYDNEEVDEMLISTTPLEGSNVTPFDLSKMEDSRIMQDSPTNLQGGTLRLKPVIHSFDDDNLQCLHVQGAGNDSFEFIGEDCSLEPMICVKKSDIPNISEVSFLANSYDFNAAHDASNPRLNVMCVGKGADGNEDEAVVVKGVVQYYKQKSIKDLQNAQVDDEVKQPVVSTRTEAVAPNRTDDGIEENCRSCQIDLEGVQIMQLPTPRQTPTPRQAPTNQNTTTMAAMVEYNQRGVAESLAQNLLLAQLNDNVPTQAVVYRKLPIAYLDSSSSEHSSSDYPERYKYLIRAKRRNQQGIVTDEDDDVISNRDPLSDGEISHYASSVGEVLPIGPGLLKNRTFMRRRPDRVFQKELKQRDMHVQRQYNYFNNWVSYYVEKNQPVNR